MAFFVCLGIFHRQKSNYGKITLCSYSINIDIIVWFFLFITTLRTSIQCHIFISVYLDHCSLAYQWFFYMYSPSPFSFWNITVLWSNTTQIVINHICVIFSRRTMSLSICSMAQLYIAREWKYSTNVYWQSLVSVKNWRK